MPHRLLAISIPIIHLERGPINNQIPDNIPPAFQYLLLFRNLECLECNIQGAFVFFGAFALQGRF